MKPSVAFLLAFGLGLATPQLHAQEGEQEMVNPAVAQMRHVIGEWDVATTFIKADGEPAGTFDGTYTFEWVMEDRIIKGMSAIPEFNMASGLLFYLRPATNEIEMVSVGPDGKLWTMTGPQGSETRETPIVDMPDGTTLKLRFTRFNVTQDMFESRMERSTDGGETWSQGNHQLFTRRGAGN